MIKPPIRLCDAHTHFTSTSEWKKRQAEGVVSAVSAGTPSEAANLNARLLKTPDASTIPTYGLHPWHAAEYSVSELEPFFEKGYAIGEIGMDSVWCNVLLDIQERVFREQLSSAVKLHKPVVLHTKGQEAQIAAILKEYQNTYLVHWYSCSEHLKDYLEQDCFFSIGPDIWWNEAVQKTASLVPADRLLIETDGMGAVRWAYEEAAKAGFTPEHEYPASAGQVLLFTLHYLARMKHLSPDEMQKTLENNFFRFYFSHDRQV